MQTKINSILIASCWMNCALCYAYQREKNKCSGCRIEAKKTKARILCKIKNCKLKQNFCYECGNMPCKSLNNIDKRYRSKYNMSIIENLNNIKKFWMNRFLTSEWLKWTCNNCWNLICVHKWYCLSCYNKKNYEK